MTATKPKRKLSEANCSDHTEEDTRKELKKLKLEESDEEKDYSSKLLTNHEHKCLTRARLDTKINTFQKLGTAIDCQKAHFDSVNRLLKFVRNIYLDEDHEPYSEKRQMVNVNKFGECVVQVQCINQLERIKQLEYFQSDRQNFRKCLKKYESALTAAVSDGEFKMVSDRLENFIGSSQLIELNFTLPRQWHRNLTNDTMKSWLETEDVYVVRRNNDRSAYGKVTVKDGRYWISNLASRRPEGCPIILSLNDMFSYFGGTLGPPNRAFLQLGDRENIIGEIIIAMEDVNPRLISKMFLNSEIKGKSYKTKTFLFWAMQNKERRKITYNDDVSENDIKSLRSSMKSRRFLFAKSYLESLLSIRVAVDDRQPVWRIFCKFGEVKEGVEVCQRIFDGHSQGKLEEIFIHNCGIVL